jgi:peroxiredoxin
MKYVVGFCFFLVACKASPPDHYTVTGDIAGLKDSTLIMERPMGDTTLVDTAKVVNGKFTFTGSVPMPVKAYLMTKERYTEFYLENANITVVGKADSFYYAHASGSSTQLVADSLKDLLKDITDQEDKWITEYGAADKSKDTLKLAIVEGQLDSLREIRHRRTDAFIGAHPNSPVSLYEITGMAYAGDYSRLSGLFSGLDTSLQHSAAGLKFEKTLAILKRRDIGQKAMDFTQTSIKGQPVTFSEFRRGHYVLLDFWASWCHPCRAENPNVLKAYNRFKSRNFTVLGVSLDDDSAKWRKAVTQDGMPWMQVSDLKGWKNQVAQQYGIEGIPFNFLVDTTGTIIASDLRGTALEKKLSQVLQ